MFRLLLRLLKASKVFNLSLFFICVVLCFVVLHFVFYYVDHYESDMDNLLLMFFHLTNYIFLQCHFWLFPCCALNESTFCSLNSVMHRLLGIFGFIVPRHIYEYVGYYPYGYST